VRGHRAAAQRARRRLAIETARKVWGDARPARAG